MKNNLDKSTLAKKIAETVASQIAEGYYEPGQRLVETELTEYFNISRSPVREALFILENQGVVEKIPRRGVRVKAISIDEINDLYDVVYNLTEFALIKGIERNNKKDIEYMEKLLVDMETIIEKREIKKFHELVEELHLKLIEFSKNKLLVDIYKNLNLRWTTFRYLTLSHPISLRKSVIEYKDIIFGIKNKDINTVSTILLSKKTRGISILENIFT
ncbi:GntR family transcriptional regulator [Oceanobacillus halophilus]|uniref:GntR family transcriptional regulator n=1 Tax=Oceanobacillus halophilus TaxID=930130 RepID=A0A495A800_9BACI|nr:GntR family transcriptional regulator [Oceanobacillus halophilus]RKQ35783.1 GntR family transcriptional regulator [Oceanobacillus halophilus]